ncbi:hypothetical protein J6590_012183 [Homalodisca vitripennis]|nr:hypothetical protein J6590_012183 [Homalodisca vitripennis]
MSIMYRVIGLQPQINCPIAATKLTFVTIDIIVSNMEINCPISALELHVVYSFLRRSVEPNIRGEVHNLPPVGMATLCHFHTVRTRSIAGKPKVYKHPVISSIRHTLVDNEPDISSRFPKYSRPHQRVIVHSRALSLH